MFFTVKRLIYTVEVRLCYSFYFVFVIATFILLCHNYIVNAFVTITYFYCVKVTLIFGTFKLCIKVTL